MYFVYVLRSDSSGKWYTGYCTDLVRRLGQHNSGVTKSTKNRGPWQLVYQESFTSRAEAMRREKFLKTGRGREEMQRILAGSSIG